MVGGKSEALEALNQHPNTTFRGSTTTPEHFYPLMDAYVLPSLSESAPLAILEAMACGVIPLSTPVGNVPSYLNNTIGFLFSPHSTSDLVSAMQSLLDAPDEQEARGSARDLVIQELIGRQALSALLELYTRRCLSPQEARLHLGIEVSSNQGRNLTFKLPVVDVTQTLQCTEHEPLEKLWSDTFFNNKWFANNRLMRQASPV